MIGKGRIEALSDGLFAIVLTLLVLDIKPPAGVPQGQLPAELAKEIPSWISFGITFFLGSLYWVHQHRVLRSLSEVSVVSTILNLVFLAFVSVLPFRRRCGGTICINRWRWRSTWEINLRSRSR